jgi:hypothetical protein
MEQKSEILASVVIMAVWLDVHKKIWNLWWPVWRNAGGKKPAAA